MTREILDNLLRMWISMSEREKKANVALGAKFMWIQKKLVDVIHAEEIRKSKLVGQLV